jgi:hypothetical protein
MLRLESAEALEAILKVSTKVVKGVRNKIIGGLTKPFEEIANKLLSDGAELKYQIEDEKFSILCTNLNGNQVEFQTLSGGEKVIYSCAQLAALVKIANPPTKLIQGELGCPPIKSAPLPSPIRLRLNWKLA